MKAAQVSGPGADFQIVEREVPTPGAGQVRIKVQACGVCHSDAVTKEGTSPGIQYPRVLGHEVVGTIDDVGDGLLGWKKGQRVGVGWHGVAMPESLGDAEAAPLLCAGTTSMMSGQARFRVVVTM